MPHLKDKETGLCLVCHRNQIAAIKEGQKFKKNDYIIRKLAFDSKQAIYGKNYVKPNEEDSLSNQLPVTKFARKMELEKLNKKIKSRSSFKLEDDFGNSFEEFDERITGRRSKKGNISNRESNFDIDDKSPRNRLTSKSSYAIYTVKSPIEDDLPSHRHISQKSSYSTKTNGTNVNDNDIVILNEIYTNEENNNIIYLTKTAEALHKKLINDNGNKRRLIFHHHFLEEDEEY